MSEPRSTSSWRQSVAIRALLVCAMAATVGLAVTPGAGAAANDQHAAQPAASRLPDGKQTTLRLYVTSREAYEKWKAAPDKVTVLDVRTPEEYVFIGHAEMAWNIPLAAQSYQWDAEKKQLPMRPLPDFVARARKVTEPEDTILVMCRSGGRSAMAVNLLAGVVAAGQPERGSVHLEPRLADLFFHVQFDRQTMTIPAGHVGCIETAQGLALDDDVLEYLVDGMPDMDVAIGVGRTIMQDEARPARTCLPQPGVQPHGLPACQNLRLAHR